MIMVSVDDHLCEPPDMWEKHLPAKWHDKAPKLIRKDGADLWSYEGRLMPNIGVNAVAGRVPEEYGMEPSALDQMRPGTCDVDARIEDMNASGMLGSICFASVPGFVGQLYNAPKDKQQALAILMAYNDWHLEERCGQYPGRFIPLSLPVLFDPELGAAEILISSLPVTLYNVATELVFSEFIRRYDDLKFCLTEGGAGWIPCFLERVDYTYEHHHRWTKLDLDKGRLPSDIFREHILACFIDDKVGVRDRDLFGIDNLAWEADYTHSDTTWPHTAEKLWESFQGEDLTDEEIGKITHGNAMKWFNYDPFKYVSRDKATVGALRAQARHVDVSLVSHNQGKPPSDFKKGYATILDIVTQMSSALASVSVKSQ
jgi:predicted TIM-barrel fold metal-dependent hydrolase